jgi:hypothetical protein
MVSFKEFMEEVQLKMRHTMPQIVDFVAFKKDLEENGINSRQKSFTPDHLKPTQKNFNDEKVDKIKEAFKDGTLNDGAIVISKDWYIVDGHHRWKAMKELDEDIQAVQVDMHIEELLEFLKGRDYIEKKTIKESV